MSDPLIRLNHTGHKGVELFNAGEYFRCHDAFEEVWMRTSGEERHYYQGLIQIAVALYKIKVERNWRGAVSLFKTGIGHLQSVDPGNVEIDIELLMAESGVILTRLQESGPEGLEELAANLEPPKIVMVDNQ